MRPSKRQGGEGDADEARKAAEYLRAVADLLAWAPALFSRNINFQRTAGAKPHQGRKANLPGEQ